jgi:hypothetical protein
MPHGKRARRYFAVTAVAASVISPAFTRADGLSADEQAFFDKHSSDVVSVTPTKLDQPAFVKVFSTPFYAVKVAIKQPDGDMTNDLVVARVDDKLVSVSRPGSDTDLPDFVKMLNPSFKLKTDADAATMERALDLAYPIIGSDDDKKSEAVVHTGNQWMFVRGLFFKDKLGFIVQTDGDGTITLVKFALKLPVAP